MYVPERTDDSDTAPRETLSRQKSKSKSKSNLKEVNGSRLTDVLQVSHLQVVRVTCGEDEVVGWSQEQTKYTDTMPAVKMPGVICLIDHHRLLKNLGDTVVWTGTLILEKH